MSFSISNLLVELILSSCTNYVSPTQTLNNTLVFRMFTEDDGALLL